MHIEHGSWQYCGGVYKVLGKWDQLSGKLNKWRQEREEANGHLREGCSGLREEQGYHLCKEMSLVC